MASKEDETVESSEPTSSEPSAEPDPFIEKSIVKFNSSHGGKMSLPSRHYPPLEGPDGFPTPADIETGHQSEEDFTYIDLPIQTGINGDQTVSIQLPSESAFKNVTQRPSYFEQSGPGPLHDTHYVLSSSGYYFDVSTYTGIIDPASGANYTLRIAKDDRDQTPKGRLELVLDGRSASVLITPRELQLLLRETSCMLLPPETDGEYQFHPVTSASQLYAAALASRDHLNNSTLDTQTEKGQEEALTGSCPITTPSGERDLLEVDVVVATATSGQPAYEVHIQPTETSDTPANISERNFAEQMQVIAQLNPAGGSARQQRQIPLPILADLLSTGQWKPGKVTSK